MESSNDVDDQQIVASNEDDNVLEESAQDVLSVDDRTKTTLTVDKELTRVANDFYDANETGGSFWAVLRDASGKELAGKEVQIAVNGKIYNVTTDSQGRAVMDINLVSANVYTYALSFSGDNDYSAAPLASTRLTITKKPTEIVAASKSFKASAKNKKLTVTFKTSPNPYDNKMYLGPNKAITLKINKKKYTLKTGTNNKVTFNINLNKKGKYTAKLSFAGTKTYAASSKSIKITIK